MNITTNNVPREILSEYELTQKELDEIDNWEPNEFMVAEFFRYKGEVYPLRNFVRIERRSEMTNPFCHTVDDNSPLLEWHGICTDSYFSGLVVRYTDDNESVVVGRVTW